MLSFLLFNAFCIMPQVYFTSVLSITIDCISALLTFDQWLVSNQCLWLFKPVSLQGILIFIDAVWLCQKPSLGVYHSCGSPLAIYCWVSLLPSSQFQYEWSVKVLLSFWVREFHNLFAFFNFQVTNLLELLILSMIRFYIVLWNAKQIMCCPRQLWQIS